MSAWQYKVLVLAKLVRIIIGFNVETSPTNVTLIRSPLRSDSSPISEQFSSFFGYNIAFDSVGRLSFNFIVGAPKVVDPNHPLMQNSSSYPSARGDVLSCQVSLNTATSTCGSSVPPNSSLGDSFGLSVNIDPDRGITACSPTKQQTCGSTNIAIHYSPGYCYIGETDSSKIVWKQDEKTSNQTCPTSLGLIDLVFLLDASGSIGRANFEQVKNWTKALAAKFSISDGSTRIGVVRYSDFDENRALTEQPFINTEIPLGSIVNQAEFDARVDEIQVTPFRTFTAHALNKTVYDFESSNRFNLANTTKVLILLTDGESNDRELLPYSAEYLRDLGVRTFAVGIRGANEEELRIVATGTDTNRRVYYVADFDLLPQIVSELTTDIRATALEGSEQVTSFMANTELEYSEYGFSLRNSKKQIKKVL